MYILGICRAININNSLQNTGDNHHHQFGASPKSDLAVEEN